MNNTIRIRASSHSASRRIAAHRFPDALCNAGGMYTGCGRRPPIAVMAESVVKQKEPRSEWVCGAGGRVTLQTIRIMVDPAKKTLTLEHVEIEGKLELTESGPRIFSKGIREVHLESNSCVAVCVETADLENIRRLAGCGSVKGAALTSIYIKFWRGNNEWAITDCTPGTQRKIERSTVDGAVAYLLLGNGLVMKIFDEAARAGYRIDARIPEMESIRNRVRHVETLGSRRTSMIVDKFEATGGQRFMLKTEFGVDLDRGKRGQRTSLFKGDKCLFNSERTDAQAAEDFHVTLRNSILKEGRKLLDVYEKNSD